MPVGSAMDVLAGVDAVDCCQVAVVDDLCHPRGGDSFVLVERQCCSEVVPAGYPLEVVTSHPSSSAFTYVFPLLSRVRYMSKRTWIVAGIVVAIPVLAVAWWLGSPLFLDTEVDEAFPMSADAEIPDDMTQEEVEEVMEEAADDPPTDVEEPMPEDAPQVLASGEFTDFDDFHEGSGTATVYELADGSRVLRLEDFEVTNGPDLHVLLVPDGDPDGRDDVEGYVDLGSLKGNIGDQNYEIPADLDLSEFGSVVIYCVPFHVLFTVATLG